ncbi:MAG TPA: hypothetical protein VHO48_14465, partial [Anaerolineaceae bacterium]|nr:hypothetical protein [Anaerolineaceae bacterium]
GLCAGLVLLGGPSIWPGLVSLAIAAGLGRWLLDGRKAERSAETVEVLQTSEDGDGQIAEERVQAKVTVPEKVSVYPSPANGDVHAAEQRWLGPWSRRGPLARFFAFAALALLVVGTLFFTHPQALSAAGASLPAYLQSWGSRGSLPGTWWLAILVFYAPIPLIFGLWGAVRGWLRGDFVDRWLSFWVLAALLIAVVNPARQPADLAWVILPLWILAAREISRYLLSRDVDLLPAFGQAALTVLILIFTWMNLGGWLTALSQNLPDARLYALVFVGALALLLVSGYLVTWGWSIRTGLRGLVWGVLAGLCLYTISAGSLAGGYRPTRSVELWTTSPVVEQVGLLVKTAADLSEQRFTNLTSIDLVAENVDSAALRWALRDFSAARFENQVAVDAQPSVIVSGQAEQPTLIAGYRGQDFILNRSPEWSSFTGYDWLNWLVYRKAPGSTQTAILWARNDLFPGGETATTGSGGE